MSTGQTYTAYGTPATLTSTVNGTLRHGFAYTPDAMGRIATITETGETPRVTTYAYDSAGRLWQVWRDGTQVAQYEHLGTDGANGNRTAWSAGGHTFTASYDGQDRLTGYTDDGAATALGYDPHGNVLTRTTGADETRYTWDPRGPLAGVQRPGGAALIEYVLDPAGRRIGRRVGGALERGWLYAGGLLPVAETDADGHTVRRVFVYATRPNVPDLVQQLEGASWVTYRVLVDHLGSVRSVVRASDGAVVQRMDYDAFGGVVDDQAANGWVRIPFGFAGGLYDRETGLVRFGAREYDARVGRWVSRDPALFGGGDSNLYRYCGGEPVNRIDPEGRAFMLVGIIFGVPIVGVVYVGVRAYNEWQQALWETERRAVALREDRQRNGRESDSPTPGIQADGYAHCVQSCGMQRRMRMTPAPIARVIGACVSAVHEWNDGPSPDSDADLRADAVGRSVSGGEGSCAALCMSIASPGVRAYEMSHPRTVQQSW